MAKRKAKKKQSPLDKIKKELGKLEALHEKENDIVEKITEIIDDGEFEDAGYDFDKWEGTNGD